jgi:hypothetical protein
LVYIKFSISQTVQCTSVPDWYLSLLSAFFRSLQRQKLDGELFGLYPFQISTKHCIRPACQSFQALISFLCVRIPVNSYKCVIIPWFVLIYENSMYDTSTLTIFHLLSDSDQCFESKKSVASTCHRSLLDLSCCLSFSSTLNQKF